VLWLSVLAVCGAVIPSMSASAAVQPHHEHAEVEPWRKLLAEAVGSAVPVLLPELCALCASYSPRKFVDWDALNIGGTGADAYVLFRPMEPVRGGPHDRSAVLGAPLGYHEPLVGQRMVDPDKGVGVRSEAKARWMWVYGKSTLRESGRTRWALRLTELPEGTGRCDRPRAQQIVERHTVRGRGVGRVRAERMRTECVRRSEPRDRVPRRPVRCSAPADCRAHRQVGG
jgi:hypothetical protein